MTIKEKYSLKNIQNEFSKKGFQIFDEWFTQMFQRFENQEYDYKKECELYVNDANQYVFLGVFPSEIVRMKERAEITLQFDYRVNKNQD